jgi:diphosphomevalonate decarboxylase
VSVSRACANIALIKYWGKRPCAPGLNLPQTSSLSITLDALRTSTKVERVDTPEDEFILDGVRVSGRPLARISAHLDLLRAEGGPKARVTSVNEFPTAAGLASSASGFAALTYAAAMAYGCNLSKSELSCLARRGSGSAARSIFGGYVQMHAGQRDDGTDAYATQLTDIEWDLNAVIAVADTGEKKIGSTAGMEHTKTTSPYHARWIQQVDIDLKVALKALRSKDFDALALVVEGSCLAMHADAMAARPGILYFSGASLRSIDTVRRLRAQGTPVFFTIDAGPHVVAFTPADSTDHVAKCLGDDPQVKQVIISSIGEGAQEIVALP